MAILLETSGKWIVKVGSRPESDDSYDIGCKSCLVSCLQPGHDRGGGGQIPFNIQHPEIITSALTLNIILQFSAGPPSSHHHPPLPGWESLRADTGTQNNGTWDSPGLENPCPAAKNKMFIVKN